MEFTSGVRRRSLTTLAALFSIAPIVFAGSVLANTGPTANNQSFTTSGQAIEVTLHATDPDGDDLSFIVVSEPQHGTLSGTAPSFLYTPSTSFNGSDSFTWKANDGTLDSNIATVSIKGVTFQSSAKASSQQTLVTELDVPRPAVDPGDLMWLHLTVTRPQPVDNVIVTDPTSSGWVQIRETHVAGLVHSYLFRKIAGVEPVRYTVRFGLPVFVAAAIGAWSGADTNWFAISEGTAIAATSVTVPGVFAVPGGKVVGFFSALGYPIGVPTEMSRQWNSFTRLDVSQLRSTSVGADEGVEGPIAARTARSSNSNSWIVQLISLRPKPG